MYPCAFYCALSGVLSYREISFVAASPSYWPTTVGSRNAPLAHSWKEGVHIWAALSSNSARPWPLAAFFHLAALFPNSAWLCLLPQSHSPLSPGGPKSGVASAHHGEIQMVNVSA